jgi:hypothetical protein
LRVTQNAGVPADEPPSEGTLSQLRVGLAAGVDAHDLAAFRVDDRGLAGLALRAQHLAFGATDKRTVG